MKINRDEEENIITYIEVDGEFDDDLGWGPTYTFLTKLKLKSNHSGDDNGLSLDAAKERFEEDSSFKPFLISIESKRENKYGSTSREDGEQENSVELSLEEAKALRNALDDMINYIESK